MNDIEIRNTSVKPLYTGKIKFAERDKRVAFVTDRSYSMASGMIGTTDQDRYDWPYNLVELVAVKAEQAVRRLVNESSIKSFGIPIPFDPDIDTVYPIPKPEKDDPFWASLHDATPDRAKAYLVSAQKAEEIGATLLDHVERTTTISKLSAAQAFLSEYITERFAHHGHADSLIIAFDDEVSYAPVKTEAALLKAIEDIDLGGGTDILGAMDATLGFLQAMAPPRGNAGEQIVLITDAMDGEAGDNFQKYLPILLSRRIVLDFLHVVMPHESSERDSAWETIKQVCEASGGQYVRVESVAMFRERFFEAANRLLIEG